MTAAGILSAIREFVVWNYREVETLAESAARSAGELFAAILGLVFMFGCYWFVYQVIVAIISGGFT